MIHYAFPTPIMTEQLNRAFTKKELEAVKKHASKTRETVSNVVSKNQYILDMLEFKALKAELTDIASNYIKQIHKPKYPIEIYITQSWLNWTSKDQYHAMHEHPNSFVSGVIYFDADRTKDSIIFYRSEYRQLLIEPIKYDEITSGSKWFNIHTGDIILFPSHMTHGVNPIKEKRTRLSLAFNTFIKGKLGDHDTSTELILE